MKKFSLSGTASARSRIAFAGLFVAVSTPIVLCGGGCGAAGNVVGGVIGATVLGAQSPSHEIEQVYYLGVFDPQEQVPSQVYRLTVRGQASFISNTKFASGWVPATLIDSLNSGPHFKDDDYGSAENTKGPEDGLSQLTTGRRMMMFGPEGFREAPRGHRLVILMGSNPDAFFEAIDQALGTIAKVEVESGNAKVQAQLANERARLETEKSRLDALAQKVDADLPAAAK